jgi:hypothetical protein
MGMFASPSHTSVGSFAMSVGPRHHVFAIASLPSRTDSDPAPLFVPDAGACDVAPTGGRRLGMGDALFRYFSRMVFSKLSQSIRNHCLTSCQFGVVEEVRDKNVPHVCAKQRGEKLEAHNVSDVWWHVIGLHG